MTKEYLYKNKKDDYVTVYLEADSGLRLGSIYDVLFSSFSPKLSDEDEGDVFVADFEEKSSGLYEVVLDVEDVDFSEFED